MINKKYYSAIAHVSFGACAIGTALLTIFFIGFIFYVAFPIFQKEGIGFLINSEWDYSSDVYGIRTFILGTLAVTAVTMTMAFPLSLFTAIFIAEFSSRRIASILRPMIELLVGIPSVVYGIFGLFILEDVFEHTIDPFIDGTFGFIPIFQDLGHDGKSVLLASTVLTVMVLPTIVTIAEDSIRSVSNSYREASFSLGATHWQTIKKMVLPTASKGIMMGGVLGMMRAMGETMAIVMLMDAVPNVPGSILDTGYAMTSKILNDITFRLIEDNPRAALFGIAAVLFLMEIIAVGFARRLGGQHDFK